MNKKTIILIVLITIFLIAGIVGGLYLIKQRQNVREKAAPATTITFQPVVTEAEIGEIINLDILVNTGENSLAAVRLDINYDQGVLQATSLTFSSLLPTILRPVNISQPGKITGSAGVATGTLISGTGQKVASLSFKVSSADPLGTTINFASNTIASSATLEDTNKNLIICNTQVKITINTPSEPTPMPTSAPTAVPTTSAPTAAPTTSTPTAAPTTSTPTTAPITSTPTTAPTAISTTSVGETNPTTISTPTSSQPIPVAGNITPTLFILVIGSLSLFSFLLLI